MLVCNVSLTRRRATIAADVAEAASALDDAGTGNVVFATLVDDPASVADFVDAYSGEIMLEAASAADSVDAGMVYTAAVDETGYAVAIDALTTPIIWIMDVAEAASASSSQDSTTTAAPVSRQRALSASRAGLGSAVAGDDGSGKTRVISNVGAVS